MRIFLLALFPVLGAIIGYLISFKYVAANEFWNGFVAWNKDLRSEISFTQKTIKELLDGEKDKSSFKAILYEYIYDNNGADKKNKLLFLSKKEKEFFLRYADNIGSSDKDSQINFIDSIGGELFSFAKEHEDKYKKYRPLCVKLGFLFGLIIFILLI